MYQFLLDRFGPRLAFWGTLSWFAMLLIVAALSLSAPEGELRYGHL